MPLPGGAGFTAGTPGPDGLERKNPVIVALGDSVTAGHFESLVPTDPAGAARFRAAGKMQQEEQIPVPPVEIFDARESYVEKFRDRLIDRFELTSVSVLNSGIAGDNLLSMARRADRDVIRYQPDLVVINGSLNWGDDLGTNRFFGEVLQNLVRKIRAGTQADLILLTPNGDLPNTMFAAFGVPPAEPTTAERCEIIREVADREQVCLADVRKVWDMARDAGFPWEELLANRINHPSVEGHEVYAKVLMQLFD